MTPWGPSWGAQEAPNTIKTNGFLTFLLFAFLAFQASFGALLGHLGALLAPLGTHLGAQGLSLGPLGGPLAPLGQLLGRPKPLLDSSWGHVGGAVCPIEPPWCHHDPFWELPDGIWGPFWTRFGAFQIQISYILGWPDERTRSIEFTNTRWNKTGD